jgi:Trk-type K+ transport system membrane component
MINNQRMMSKNNSVGVNHNSQTQKNSFAVFKYLIVTTSIVFTFGGIGFGLAWRCGQDLQLSQSQINSNSSHSVNSLSPQ